MTFLLVGSVIISCGEPQPEENNDDNSIEVTDMDNPEDNSFLYVLPSPLQIASIFRRSGLEYIPGLTNDPGKSSNYNTKFIQKLNFGVYATDLAYSALNEKNQDCISYVKVLGELSESLWMTNVFSSVSILNRFEQNMGNSDSLGYIIADFQMELDAYLEENGLSTNSLIIFSGAWIESMYVAFKSIEKKSNPQLLGRLIEQRKIADNLIEILHKEEKSADVDMLISHLKKINTHFTSYDLEEIEGESDLEKLKMSPENITMVLADVTAARNYIVNG
jgi:hypothetical protein